jgi:hypothetical protein
VLLTCSGAAAYNVFCKIEKCKKSFRILKSNVKKPQLGSLTGTPAGRA